MVKKRYALLFTLVACTGATTAEVSNEAALGANYTTPDENNIWTQGVNLHTTGIGVENVLPGEEEMFQDFAQRINRMQDGLATKLGTEKQRGFHAKAHACALGTFSVHMPDSLNIAKHGVFAQNTDYPVWVRYSNGVGFSQSDKNVDVRGLALKVMKVAGRKLLAGAEDAQTQDFLMTNGATTPAPDSRQFVAFGEAMANATIQSSNGALGPIEAMLGTGGYLVSSGNSRVREYLVYKATRAVLTRGSILGEQFWTGGAIAMGLPSVDAASGRTLPPQPAKLTAITGRVEADGSCRPISKTPNVFDANYLRSDVKDRMRLGSTCIDIRMQLQRSADKQPLEDTSVEWLESDTPFTSVATVVLAPQDLDNDPAAQERESFCNSLGFTPWHAHEEHRPMGNIMRARKAVYEASKTFRGGRGEPTGNEYAVPKSAQQLIRSRHDSSQCLTHNGNGNDTFMSACDVNNPKQRWILATESASATEFVATIRAASESNQCIDMHPSEQVQGSGYRAYLYDCLGQTNQKWVFRNGEILQKFTRNNYCLDWWFDNGNVVHTPTCHSSAGLGTGRPGDNQLWDVITP